MTDVKKTKVFLVQINYKSGVSVQAWFEKFDMKHNLGKIVEIDYLTAYEHFPRPIVLGELQSIDSVWILEVKEIDKPAS